MVTCEVIIHGYEEYGIEIINKLSGIFCSVLYDPETKGYVAARDPVGVNPVYQGWLKDGSVWFASEMKCLVGVCERIVNFPPILGPIRPISNDERSALWRITLGRA